MSKCCERPYKIEPEMLLCSGFRFLHYLSEEHLIQSSHLFNGNQNMFSVSS